MSVVYTYEFAYELCINCVVFLFVANYKIFRRVEILRLGRAYIQQKRKQ